MLPLLVLQIYLRSQPRRQPGGQWTMAAGLALLTVGMGIGIAAAAAFMWWPQRQA